MNVLLIEDMSSDERAVKVYDETILKMITISKNLLYSNMIIIVNIVCRTNDIWFVDGVVAIAWTIVVL